MTVKFIQDPDAVLDYTLDWSKWLVTGDRLIAATFTPDPGLVCISVNNTDTYGVGWFIGGVVGTTYSVVCHITTEGGRQDDRTFQIVIRET